VLCSWTASIFYFGQAASEFICLYLLHKLPIRSFVAASIVVWAVVVACQAATKNFTDMMIVRFFLGFTEGAVAPAFVLMTSFFYRKREQPIRIAVFVSFNALAQCVLCSHDLSTCLDRSVPRIVGALLLYGCGSIKGGALKGWRISFLICAALTILIGIYFFVFVPKSPSQAWFLTPEEREVAVARVAQERAVSLPPSLLWSAADGRPSDRC
jgi:MFS family permease